MSQPKYYVAKDGAFVIEQYGHAPTFASFFPGIAGVFGCPMWVFYTNRGQCITSAGVHDKNSAILEFNSANKAYRNVALQGFRTFLKIDGKFYEPFSSRQELKRELRILPHSIKISEENPALKLRVEVAYFTVPGERFPALARVIKLTNLGKKARQLEVIDGLPAVIPYGFENDLLKRISTTIEAWCTVENLANGAPFYKLKIMPADVSETRFLRRGNFFYAFCQDNVPVEMIVEPATVFGENSSLEVPERFLAGKTFTVPAEQLTEGIIPSAFAYKKAVLTDEFELASLFGQMDNVDLLNQAKPSIDRNYLAAKFLENKTLIDDITARIKTISNSHSFDLYARNTFLDNVMRGGLPLIYDGKVVYVYYRKHGDMERDYNDFKLMPIYFSQGDGNYRDINQNRRNDLFFNPDIGADNISRYFNLVQLDGYNPLVVLGSKYFIKSPGQAEALIGKHIKGADRELLGLISRPFLLGAVLKKIEVSGATYKTGRETFVVDLLENSAAEEGAYHGEGFWIDHPFYNLDLLESFESLFPDRLADLLYDQKTFTFYDNDHVVVPRRQKYRLVGDQVRQYECVRLDIEKSSALKGRTKQRTMVRADYGKGEVYHTTLAAKLLCIAVNKAATFDAAGVGIEMEADKPDWYDALNGLPALFGSSLSETLELKRLALYLKQNTPADRAVALPEELKEYIDEIALALDQHQDPFAYWDQSYELKEAYRQRTKLGVSGRENTVDGAYINAFLDRVIKKCDRGVQGSLAEHGNYYTYFINEVAEYETIEGKVKIKRFRQRPLPLFLEGFVHALKVNRDKNIPGLVKNSPLYDQKLKMYKVNDSLKQTPIEIGRCRVFAPGWLENESVWLHMEYKYMLELLKAGMYQEFFADFKNVFVPYMNPKKYKRSILENSSFIVSSANPNQHNHGRGFVARLSGGAAEFIDIWINMTAGKRLFQLDAAGQLCFRLAPVLPAWLFNKGKLMCRLLGSIDVIYLNPKGKDTFGNGVSPASYQLIFDDGEEVDITGQVVKEPYASLIRQRKVKKIVVTLS
ncbi:MAG: hypothetical protein WC529_03700 [Candidatus Margulisiibacteriota bacterium]